VVKPPSEVTTEVVKIPSTKGTISTVVTEVVHSAACSVVGEVAAEAEHEVQALECMAHSSGLEDSEAPGILDRTASGNRRAFRELYALSSFEFGAFDWLMNEEGWKSNCLQEPCALFTSKLLAGS
jgi:hypothetical protein